MDTDAAADAEAARPDFPALTAREMGGGKDDFRRIRCPPHRLTPLRNSWENIVTPTVEHMKLQIRYEWVKCRCCWWWWMCVFTFESTYRTVCFLHRHVVC